MIASKRSEILSGDMNEYGEDNVSWTIFFLELTGMLYRALEDEQYSDVSIKCQHKTFKVHKVIICNRCESFKKACEGAFQVSIPSCPGLMISDGI
jgi:hypothetical protein